MKKVNKRDEWEDFWEESKPSFSKNIVNFMRRYYFSKRIIDQLGDYSGKIVLEAGSGTCESLIYISKKAKKVIGLDKSKNAIKLGYRNFKSARLAKGKYQLILGDIMKIPLKDDSCDIVYNAGVIEHFDNVQPIKEMLRVTKKMGNVVILVPAKHSIYSWIFQLLNLLGLRKFYPWEDHKLYNHAMMRDELKKAGAKNIVVRQPISLFGIYIVGVAVK